MSNVFVVTSEAIALEKSPRLAYETRVSGATITASHDQANVAYIHDGMTTMKWRPGVVTSSIQMDGTFTFINYVAIVGANWYSSGCQVEIKNLAGDSLGIANGLRDNQPVFFVFDTVSESRITIEFSCSNDTLEIGEVYMGRTMEFPKNVSVGYKPARWNSNDVVNTGMTQSNQFAGSVVRARGSTESFSINKVDVSFLQGSYRAFLRDAKGIPIFFLWDKNNHDQAVFGNWESNSPAFEAAYLSSVSITIDGIA